MKPSKAEKAAFLLLAEKSKTNRDRKIAQIMFMSSMLDDEKVIEIYQSIKKEYDIERTAT